MKHDRITPGPERAEDAAGSERPHGSTVEALVADAQAECEAARRQEGHPIVDIKRLVENCGAAPGPDDPSPDDGRNARNYVHLRIRPEFRGDSEARDLHLMRDRLRRSGFEISLRDAERAWRQVSSELGVPWLEVPNDGYRIAGLLWGAITWEAIER